MINKPRSIPIPEPFAPCFKVEKAHRQRVASEYQTQDLVNDESLPAGVDAVKPLPKELSAKHLANSYGTLIASFVILPAKKSRVLCTHELN